MERSASEMGKWTFEERAEIIADQAIEATTCLVSVINLRTSFFAQEDPARE